jgi:hypothetical protein
MLFTNMFGSLIEFTELIINKYQNIKVSQIEILINQLSVVAFNFHQHTFVLQVPQK